MPRSRFPAARAAAFLSIAGALLAAGCGDKSAAGAPPGGAPPPPEVTVVTVAPRTVAVPYEFNGRVEGSREVEVHARVSGILLRRSYEEGRPVRQGQTLFVIDPGPYRAEVQAASADVAEERARLSRAERDVARLKPLIEERAVSRREYDNAVSTAEEARATMQSAQARLAQARLDLSYTTVAAPISGASSRAEHSEGSLVGPGAASLLTRISRVQPIWVRFSASDQVLSELRRAVAAKEVVSPATNQLEVELVVGDDSVHPEHGRVNFSDSLIDSATGSVELRAELPNAAGDLIPGQFVRVRLLGIERPNAILVPQRAVQQGQEGKFVYVVGADGKAAPRPITVGDWLGRDWIVESGLAAGDRVIVDGALKVAPGAPVQVVDAAATPAGPPTTAKAGGPGH
ncbi:MAG TPA: efflux RND transporter periplasmic adaptor subunit [Thermoanaerobaculia bacterium]|nr:efflux RND transporter periplasmic adaptor subunit [Thermoanaerobaculia bacterium]